MRTVKPSGDFLVPVVVSGHDAVAKASDFAAGAGLAQIATDAGGGIVELSGISMRAFQKPKMLGTKVFAAQAYSDAGLNRTYSTGIALDQHFDAVRIGFYNANATNFAGLKCSVAVGPDASNKTAAGLTWVGATFAGASTVTQAAGDAANQQET